MKAKTKTYRFEAGNSTEGAIGAVVRVEATSAKEAKQLLDAAVPWEGESIRSYGVKGRVDIRVYFGGRGWGKPEVEE